MTRVIIEGTPGNLTIVNPTDVPTRGGLSYFRHCDIRGNWAGRSLSYSSTVDCLVSANFSRCDIEGIESSESIWDGVILSEQQEIDNYCCFDIRNGVLWPLIHNYSGFTQVEKDALLVEKEKSDMKTLEGRQLVGRMATVLGKTVSETEIILATILSSKAHLVLRLNDETTAQDEPALNVVFPNRGRVKIPFADWPAGLRAVARTLDRWELSRASERYMNATYPDDAPWVCRWEKLYPRVKNTCESEAFIHPDALEDLRWRGT